MINFGSVVTIFLSAYLITVILTTESGFELSIIIMILISTSARQGENEISK